MKILIQCYKRAQMASDEQLIQIIDLITEAIEVDNASDALIRMKQIPFDDLDYDDYKQLTTDFIGLASVASKIIPYDPEEYTESSVTNDEGVVEKVPGISGFLENHRDLDRVKIYRSTLRTLLTWFNERQRYYYTNACLFVPWLLTLNDLGETMEDSDTIASIIIQTLTEYSFSDFITYYIKFEEDPTILHAVARIQRIMGEQNYYVYEDILRTYRRTYSDTNNPNDDDVEYGPVAKFILAVQANTKPYIDKPYWVTDHGLGKDDAQLRTILAERELDSIMAAYSQRKQAPTEKELESANIYLKLFTGLPTDESLANIDMANYTKEMLGQVPGQSEEVIATMTDPILRLIGGPPNPSEEIDPHDRGLCARLGHPMFFCNEWERGGKDSDDDLEELEEDYYSTLTFGYQDTSKPNTEWFTGRCANDRCGKGISHYTHAVRKPMRDGGFQGTYCSWECVQRILPPNDIEIGAMLDYAVIQLKQFGVQERD